MVNLKWQDAMAVAGQHFKTKEERAAGWPQTMKPDQLAALQRPYARAGIEHRPGRRLTEALLKAIVNACARHALPCTATTSQQARPARSLAPVRVSMLGGRFESSGWGRRDFPQPAPVTSPTPKEATVYNVTAPDFAAWLTAQGEPPSPHIAAWIEAAQAVIEPPDSWRVQSEFGMLRFGATPAGRLVRLADLVQWLMDRNEWPCGVAVERVCNALRTDGADRWLYLLDAGGYAKPLGPGDCFAWKPILSFWDQEPVHDEADCGLAGVIKHMTVFWGNETAPSACRYLGREVLDPLAIHLDKAFELWDYGRLSSTHEAVPLVAAPVASVALTVEAIKGGVGKIERDDQTAPTTWADLIVFRKAHPAANWTQEQKMLLVSEFQARGRAPGVTGLAVAMAMQLDITVSRFNELKRTTSQQGKRISAHQKSA